MTDEQIKEFDEQAWKDQLESLQMLYKFIYGRAK
jgi:hypothetical protein